MPTADDLFRPTASPENEQTPSQQPAGDPTVAARAADPAASESTEGEESADGPEGAARRPSGRVRHDEKMTVYVTADELLDLEHARLTLRRSTGLAVDRGRLVREAIAIVLADLDEHGEDSVLVERLKRS